MLLPFSVFILFSCRFHVITEKIAASLSCAERNLETWVVTGVRCSARRLKGRVLSTHGGRGDGGHTVKSVGLQQKGEIKATESQSFALAASPHLEVFFADPDLESFFPFSVSKANYLKFLNLLDRIFIKTK